VNSANTNNGHSSQGHAKIVFMHHLLTKRPAIHDAVAQTGTGAEVTDIA
jgi:hypothetical protein